MLLRVYSTPELKQVPWHCHKSVARSTVLNKKTEILDILMVKYDCFSK